MQLSDGRKCGSFPTPTTLLRWVISRRNSGGECWLSLTARVKRAQTFAIKRVFDLVRDALLHRPRRYAAMTIFPVLAQAANSFAKTDGERSDRFEALLAAVRKLAIILAAHFGEQQFRIAQDSRERIVQLVAQGFSERFLIILVAQQRRCDGRFLDGLVQALFYQINRHRKTTRRARDEIREARRDKRGQLVFMACRCDDDDGGIFSERRHDRFQA